MRVPVVSVEAGDVIHILCSQLKIEDLGIGNYPLWGDRFGDDNIATLNSPAKKNLWGRRES